MESGGDLCRVGFLTRQCSAGFMAERRNPRYIHNKPHSPRSGAADSLSSSARLDGMTKRTPAVEKVIESVTPYRGLFIYDPFTWGSFASP